MSEASTDTSQKENLEEEISTETNPIEEPESEIITDLSEKDKEKKKEDELPETYKPRVSFSSVVEAGSSTLESPSPSELKLPLVTSEYPCLKSNDTLSVPIISNSTPKSKTQFMSILEEQIRKIIKGTINGFVTYLTTIKNGDVKYFLKIDNKILKFIKGHLLKIGNPIPLKFVNPIFDTR